MKLKRLWDTTTKQIVWAKGPNGKDCQVWTNDDGSKLYVYDNSKWNEYTPSPSNDGKVFWPTWKVVDWDDEVWFYDTNKATDLYTWESGDEASYRFMNWTTVLQSWKVDEGQTPSYTGETPTKPSTAQYSYTFSWWEPTVWPIYKKTDFKAQFSSTVNEYTVSISSNDTDYGTVDVASVADVPYGTAISAEGNVLTIGTWASATEVTATAEDGYAFSSWWELPATVTGNTSIQASFAFGPLQNYVLPNGSGGLTIFGDVEATNYIEVFAESIPGTSDDRVVVGVWGIFEDDAFVGTYWEENQNGWEYIFLEALELEDLEYLINEWAEATDWEWKSGVWSALQTYYATPTKANADAVITAISATRDDVSGALEPITWTIPEPTLLTYSELKALGTAQAILAELNTNDEGYYASLTTEGHVYEDSPEAWVTVAAMAEVVGQTAESTTPLIVDGSVFMYMIEWTPQQPGVELLTWFTKQI